MQEVLSTQEVSQKLGISPRHVARLVADGMLSPVAKAPGLRGAFMFTRDEVEQVKVMRELQTAGKPRK